MASALMILIAIARFIRTSAILVLTSVAPVMVTVFIIAVSI
jgi:hypothetical protein